MPQVELTAADAATARRLWHDYLQTHDVHDLTGQAVGIDPRSGRNWFGESALEIVARQEAEGVEAPLLFLRVGSPYLRAKGRAPWITGSVDSAGIPIIRLKFERV